MKYIASCSFGKDSVATIIARIEQGEPIHELVYCRIMYNETISAEYPRHEDFIHNRAIPEFQERYGLKTKIVQSEMSYLDWFYRKKEKGNHIGDVYGFPHLIGPWCNTKLKTRAIEKYERSQGEHRTIVGIAADEKKRIPRAIAKGQILPLVDYGIAESAAFEICKKHDLLSPEYDGDTTRLGCWFCHNQRIAELRKLRNKYPQLWSELMRIENDSPRPFKPRGETISMFDKRFASENLKEE